MTKQGYLIAKNNLKETFFTSSSSYDRPTFVEAKKATTYLTVEMAESALKKLLKNGTFTARIVALAEAIQFELPNGQTVDPQDPNASVDPNAPTDLNAPVDPEAQGDEDLDDDEDDQAMVAKDQSGNPDAEANGDTNPDGEDIDSEVDQLLGNDQLAASEQDPDADADPTADPAAVDPDADPEALDPNAVDGAVPRLPGDLPPEDGDEEDPLAIPGEEDQDPNQRPVRESQALTIKQIPVLAVNKSDVEVNDSNCETKCKVPSEVVSALSSVKAEYERQSKYAGNNEDHKKFALTVAGAMEELIELLKQGTVHGVKLAQVKMTSLMSPILHLVPDNVVKFIAMGGRKPTLQDLFNTKRFEKKSK